MKENILKAGSVALHVDFADQLKMAQSKFKLYPDIATAQGLRVGDIMISRSGNLRLVIEIENLLVKFISLLNNGEVQIDQCILCTINPAKLIGVLRRTSGHQPMTDFEEHSKQIQNDSSLMYSVQALLDFCTDRQGARKVSLLYDEYNVISRGLCGDDRLVFRRLEVHLSDFYDFSKELVSKIQLFFGFTEKAKQEIVFSSIIANEIINSMRYLICLRESNITESV